MRKSLTACTALLVLSVCSVASAAGDSAPAWVWTQSGPGAGLPGSSANVYYCGGVFNGKFYTGELNWGPMAFASTQTGEPLTALVHEFKTADEGNAYNGVRTSVVIGDYIFFNRTDKAAGKVHLNRLNSDWTNLVAFPTDNMGNDVAPEGMTTDGISLFTTQSTSKNVIRKYSIENQADSFTLTKTLNVTVAGAATFRAISYYNGSIYAVDNGAGKGIYQINASTGAYTQIGTHIGAGAYQAVRYGNRLFVVDGIEGGTTNNLTIYNITGATLGTATAYNLTTISSDILGLWGIGVVGTGNNVTGFWVNSSNGRVSFFSYATCNEPFADSNADGFVDMNDFAAFQKCYSVVEGALPIEPAPSYLCQCFDSKSSGKVDLVDLDAFMLCATGPANPWVSSTGCP
jgi:hypothetical protein